MESEYTDRHYLEEYTSYYATLLHPPRGRTSRLHVFRTEFDEEEFEALLRGAVLESPEKVSAELSESYLGCITIRPIPSAPIGRTLLRPYGEQGQRTYQPALRACKAYLAGLELSLPALPFLQQDLGVGACATAALWSALSKSCRVAGMRAPTPYAITSAATRTLLTDRLLPATSGLELSQLAAAVRDHRLEPLTMKVAKQCTLFLWVLKVYLQSGIPAVLYFQKEGEGHAVAVSGYKEDSDVFLQIEGPGVTIRTRGMSRIYVHDDRIGPYVKMKASIGAAEDYEYLQVERLPFDHPGDNDDVQLLNGSRILYALYPIYPKLRTSAVDLIDIAGQLTPLINLVISGSTTDAPDLMVDTWFELNGDYLERLYKMGAQTTLNAERVTSLVRELRASRYVGVLRWLSGNNVIADVLCDTTDVPRGGYESVIGIFFYADEHASRAHGYESLFSRARIF